MLKAWMDPAGEQHLREAVVGMTQHTVSLYFGLVLLHNDHSYHTANTYRVQACAFSHMANIYRLLLIMVPLSRSCFYSHFTNEQAAWRG